MPDQPPAAPESKDQFQRHKAYRELMGGGRRKPALPIGGPSVTWHLGFWVPQDKALSYEQWVEGVEHFIRKLYHHLEDLAQNDEGFHPRTRSLQKAKTSNEKRLHLLNNIYSADDRTRAKLGSLKGQANRYQTFRVRFFYAAVPVSVSLELNDEYFMLSTIIDLALKPDYQRFPIRHTPDFGTIEELRQAIESFNKIATVRYGKVRASQSEASKHADRDAFRKPCNEIYTSIWERFYARIFELPYQEAIRDKELGYIFANVRGFLAYLGSRSFIGKAGAFAKKPSAALRIGNKTFDSKDAVRRTDVLLPWLKADEGFTSQDGDKDADRTEPVEFTFTQLADGRAILGSALGAQLSRRRDDQAPMTYVVLARNQASWQIGRIAHHLHTLVALRLAALYDLQHLIKAGLELRELDAEVDKKIGALSLITSKDEQGGTHAQRTGGAAKQLFELSGKLTNIGRQPDEDCKPQIAGGLAHRVERSRYYRGQADQVAQEMRDGRIEGFPTYTAAARRRLGGIYELIDMVGNRFARLQDKLAAINRQLRTAELLQLQQRITTQTTAIEEFQRVAEIGFFLVLFPHYVSLMISDLVGEAGPWTKRGILVGSFLFGIILLNRRRWQSAREFCATHVFPSDKKSC
jgi:hypothetical protein